MTLRLRLSDGRKLTYVSEEGQLRFFDPSVTQPGPHAALVERADFLAMLEREHLSAFWIIAGEKSAYAGRDSGMGWGGELAHTYIYELAGEQFICHKFIEQTEPRPEQLRVFLGRNPSDERSPSPNTWRKQ